MGSASSLGGWALRCIEIESLIFLLAAAALLAQLARVLKVPYPILLVLGGLVMGFVPGPARRRDSPGGDLRRLSTRPC